MTLSERILIDDEAGIVTIDGVKFSAEALEFFTKSTPEGVLWRTERVDNILIVHQSLAEGAPA